MSGDGERPVPTQQQINDLTRTWRLVMHHYAERVHPAVAEAVRAWEVLVRALRQAGAVDAEGTPVRPPDRPKWQSPYGPPQRRWRK